MSTVLDAATFHRALWGIGATCVAPCTPDPPEIDEVFARAFFGFYDPLLTLYVEPDQYGYALFLEPAGFVPPFQDYSGPPDISEVSIGDLPPNPKSDPPPSNPPITVTSDPPIDPQNPPRTSQQAVPEPGTWSVVALGLLAISAARLKRAKRYNGAREPHNKGA
jgi:hypothetical protein